VTLSIFTQNSDNHFCCLITGNFENEIPELDSGTTISGFADNEKKNSFRGEDF
jgi:hypothetical protein